ncbi:hypothetical protein BGM19_38630 [Streptomyces agglomeratus]|uniref:Uncharacterized protein n=1 Tax=Streptomyces agglomeratus TaxID=285458 RepID=A0A1E5NYL0_9ACTN|nr:hypothetical protein AS594_38210 [Streptomyces agglomeratus]OEJ36411.1 hypothetical protein BGK72_37430 [Streptomyces agglomeratus]OEJ56568.1 hypothetical protein BGM19_38630 [Streptomyces agglomeratus]
MLIARQRRYGSGSRLRHLLVELCLYEDFLRVRWRFDGSQPARQAPAFQRLARIDQPAPITDDTGEAAKSVCQRRELLACRRRTRRLALAQTSGSVCCP